MRSGRRCRKFVHAATNGIRTNTGTCRLPGRADWLQHGHGSVVRSNDALSLGGAMPDVEETAAFVESLTAGYACRSWFCRDRGPFLTKTVEAAEQLAAEHRALKWLGLWHHWSAPRFDCSPWGRKMSRE